MLKTIELLRQLGATSGESAKSPMEKMNMLVDYIAEHTDGTQRDEEAFEEIIFAAKKNIAETVVNAGGLNQACGANDKVKVSMFLLAPETVATNMVQEKLAESSKGENRNAEKQAKYTRALNLLRGKEITYTSFEQVHSEKLDDILNLSARLQEFGGDQPIKEAFKTANKKGFFEWMFRRTSREYNSFKATFERRAQGDASREELDGSAKAYLRRKLRGYDGNGLPNIEEISRLSRREKNRALLCYKTLLATQASKEYEERFAGLKGEATASIAEAGEVENFERMRVQNYVNLSSLDVQNAQNNRVANDKAQADFQQGLANNLHEKAPRQINAVASENESELSMESDDEPSIIDA